MLLSVLSMASCRSAETKVETEYVYVDRCYVDTVLKVEADTASLHALMECDSLGNVLMSELTTLQGQRVSVAPQIVYRTIKDENGIRRAAYMSVVALADSLQQQVSVLEEQTRKERSVSEDKKIETENPFLKYLWGFIFGVMVSIITYLSLKK